jgi:hypothetical protein
MRVLHRTLTPEPILCYVSLCDVYDDGSITFFATSLHTCVIVPYFATWAKHFLDGSQCTIP